MFFCVCGRSLLFVLLQLLFNTALYSGCCAALLLSTPSPVQSLLASGAAISVVSAPAPSLHLAITPLPLT